MQGWSRIQKRGADMDSLKVTLCGITLDNPIIPASGTYGFGKEFNELYDISILGSLSFKGTTINPWPGNPTPRIAECPSGMINSVGLQNPGIDHIIAHELIELKDYFNKPVMANISGFSLEDYLKTCKKIATVDNVGWIELNISCPNIKKGGMSFGADPDAAFKVTSEVKKVIGDMPLIVKLTPNVTSITDIAVACEEGGADGLSLINTVLAMRIDIQKRAPLLANKMGGLSGPAIFPLAVRMVYQVYEAVKIPIVGMGGISCAEDVIEMMMAGATAVEVGSASLVEPYACKHIIEDLPQVMHALEIDSLASIIGAAH